ncbi:MAG: diguanylate cyclase [Candidatus Gracilibacteria bacterium]|nr:diguanylate cyclase [Candidatus Gracilibacteria bacterium]MDD2908467.1 diguanylate cyclase [Candidatus Gracilibacteria bacterium]
MGANNLDKIVQDKQNLTPTNKNSFLENYIIPMVQTSLEKIIGTFSKSLVRKISKEVQKIIINEGVKNSIHSRSILNSLSDYAINFQDENHIIIDCNDTYIKLVGFPKNEIIGKKCTEIFCTGGNCKEGCPIEHAKKGEKLSFICDLEDRIYEKKAEMVFDDSGKFLGYVETYQDRTEIIQKDRELQALNIKTTQTKEFLESALENSKQGIWEWNMQTGEVEADNNFYKMLGYDPKKQKMSYEFWDQIIHPEDKSIIQEELGKHIRGMTEHFQFTYRLRHKNGEYIWLTATGKVTEVDLDNNPLKAIGTHMDLTEITNMKNFLIANEQKLQAIIGSIPDLLLVLDKEGKYKEIYTGNPNYFIGNRKVGASIWSIFDNKNSKVIQDKISKAIKTQNVESITYNITDSTGKTHYFSGKIRALNDDEVVIITRDITKEKEKEREIEFLAMHDVLTKLPNRAYFNEEIPRFINLSSRQKNKLAVLYFDLDGFKNVNDTHGHDVGDKLLIEVGNRINSLARESDIFARIGGDEFGMIINNYKRKENLSLVCERIIKIINEPFNIDGYELRIGTSIGISLFPEDGVNQVELQKKADIAMYRVKNSGKNGFRFFEGELDINKTK